MHVVLVDDNKAIIEGFKRNIKDINEITEFKGFMFANKALEYIKLNDVDVVFLDIRLIDDNDSEGIELAREINKISPATRIIFATDYNTFYEQANSDDVNAYSYITKPLTKETIIAKISKINQEIKGVHNKVEVNMFGNFDVLVNSEPIHFSRKKSKETLAYLVAQRGKYITSVELCSKCFDEEAKIEPKTLSTFMHTLKKDLDKYGIGYIYHETSDHKYKEYKINPDKIKCDYYDFLDNNAYAIKKYDYEFCKNIILDDPYAWNIEIREKLNSIKGK